MRSPSKSRARGLAVAAAVAVLLSACGGSDAPAAPAPVAPTPAPEAPVDVDPLDAACEAGASEGAMQFWAPFAEENFQAILAVFNARYPGVDVVLTPLRPEDSLQRISAETAAGSTPDVDALSGNLDVFAELNRRGLVDEAYDWAALGVPEDLIDAATNHVRVYRVPLGIAYNMSNTNVANLPNTWEELLDEKWAGQIITDPRGIPFNQLAMEWGAERTVDYVTRFKANNPIIIRGGTAGMLAVVGGEATMTTGGRSDSERELRRDGAPIAMKYLDIVPTVDFYNFIMEASPRKNAAACFIGWFVSPEGQETQSKIEFKTNDTIPPDAPAGAVFVAIDTADEAALVRSVGEQLQAVLAD
jgi:iron(III) transport system substrate-binding protein